MSFAERGFSMRYFRRKSTRSSEVAIEGVAGGLGFLNLSKFPKLAAAIIANWQGGQSSPGSAIQHSACLANEMWRGFVIAVRVGMIHELQFDSK